MPPGIGEWQETTRSAVRNVVRYVPRVTLLHDAAERSVRVVALEFLARVRGARARLGRPEDSSALHDFRVAVRRLRSWLTVQAPLLGRSAPVKARRRLRRLAQATNPSRDDEVFAEWLASERDPLDAEARAAADWLLARIARHRKSAESALDAEIDRDLDRAIELLDERLPRYSVPHHVERGSLAVPFAAEMAALALTLSAGLRRRLSVIRSGEDAEAVHRARIAGKRLRYLLEPIEALVPEGKECIAQLKALQDLLGDHHDTHVWLLGLTEATPRAPRAALRTGLATIAAHVRQRSDQRFAAISESWLGGEPPLFAAIGRLAASLAGSATEGIEIERKYLLSALPKRMPKRRLERIAQGYLPGERLIERVRRVRSGKETRYYRTVKGGAGLARIELEEECSAETFAALWRLTTGRRVLKRRHLVMHDGREWAVDEFAGRELVLAEIELPSLDAEVVLPPWLAPLVVREVTGDPAYLNVVLAR